MRCSCISLAQHRDGCVRGNVTTAAAMRTMLSILMLLAPALATQQEAEKNRPVTKVPEMCPEVHYSRFKLVDL